MEYIYLSKENEQKTIEKAIKIIKNGGVIILPTDTVYGIAADAQNENAVKKIYELKNREFSKPCNILVSNIEMIKEVTTNISKKEKSIIKEHFPRSVNDNI